MDEGARPTDYMRETLEFSTVLMYAAFPGSKY
jgi:hypothetical protein